MFKPVQNPPKFSEIDNRLLKRWKKLRIFERSIEEHEGAERFVFYDGPPGTNGVPHIGHLMQSALKDLWPRFETMRGKQVLRKAGWDTHGLPVELTADRELGLQTKLDIEKYGVKKYTEYCQKTVFRFKGEWEEMIRRCGRFLDLENFYATYKTSYIQSDWWILKLAWETRVPEEFVNPANLLGGDRFLYKDYRISAWCSQQGTTLSNFEVAQGYEEVTELALFPKFKVKGEENLYLVAWTTTAWTLLSNLAVAVGPDIEYLRLRILKGNKAAGEGEILLVARERVEELSRFIGDYEVINSVRGSELSGLEYEPLWDWQKFSKDVKAHYVISDSYVTADDGTGMVHLAPYGEDDFRLIKQYGLKPVLVVNEHGYVEPAAGQFAGKWFKDDELELSILKDLAARNLLLGKEKHTHTYPFHYKTGSPLMYFPRPGWFIRTTAMRQQMIEANQLINWYPERIRDGRFGKWLENVIDWNITRERYWGSPLPIWSSSDDGEAVAVGSIRELNEHLVRSGKKPLPPDADLHKPEIDELVLTGSRGQELHRENFVLDSWYNAGIMPWGQVGYPEQPGSVEYVKHQYPADFICEGLDQTRGWFYSLLACSTLVAVATGEKDKSRWSSYRNVICTDLVLDEEGEKMSKSKGNVIPPVPVMEKYGADAVRWSFYRNNPWNPIRYGEETLGECLRQVFIPLWNAYSFFVTYANVDGWTPDSELEMGPATSMDEWIITCLNDLITDVTVSLEKYDVMPAAVAITDFIDRLTNWYIRRSRRRFWKSEEVADKHRAYHTLYTVLTRLIHVLAPFAPFISDEMYLNLEGGIDGKPDSIHLADWPVPREEWRNDSIKNSMDAVRKVVSLGRSCRNEAKRKVRQPLHSISVKLPGGMVDEVRKLEELILDELNIKEIRYVERTEDFVSHRAKADFKKLGPRFGKEVQAWAKKIEQLDSNSITQLLRGESITVDGQVFTETEILLFEDIVDGYVVKEEQGIFVALDIRLTEELIDEGYARELINKVQNRRKELDLDVTQRIRLQISCDDRISRVVESYREVIFHEVLAVDLEIAADEKNNNLVKINDRQIWFDISPIS